MSNQRSVFEAELNKPQPNWTTAADNLSALAMFEMLPTFDALAAAKRAEVLKQTHRVLMTEHGWTRSFCRIDFAMDVVNDRKLSSWPATCRGRTS